MRLEHVAESSQWKRRESVQPETPKGLFIAYNVVVTYRGSAAGW